MEVKDLLAYLDSNLLCELLCSLKPHKNGTQLNQRSNPSSPESTGENSQVIAMLRLISRRLVSLTTSTVTNVPCKSEFHSISTTLLRSDRQLTRLVTQNNVCFNCGDPGHMRREFNVHILSIRITKEINLFVSTAACQGMLQEDVLNLHEKDDSSDRFKKKQRH
ncbi:hypothetical protein DdX_12753 [Ditylenchus destructor]|uniref:CCHC-type domain-containing protein n=1 Tax=Ditylenchus destructor TaxID=166010 RepID=A0AAD4MZZ8_9BILA|nr:hypothetical protein DdX_12753 [Ditylenchus destructor]